MIKVDGTKQVWSHANIEVANELREAGFQRFYLSENGIYGEVVGIMDNVPVLENMLKVDLSWLYTNEHASIELNDQVIYFDGSDKIANAIRARNKTVVVLALEDIVSMVVMKAIMDNGYGKK
jgi:hypothetical protein